MYYFLPHETYPTLIHHVNQQHVEYNPSGHLSIKCIFNGHAVYELDDGRRYDVHDGGFLILNYDQPYTVYKDWPNPMITFGVAFPQDLLAQVLTAETTSVAKLLDSPNHSGDSTSFFERIYPYDTTMLGTLAYLREKLLTDKLSHLELEETLYSLLRLMLQTQNNIYQEMEQLSAVRTATRQELYRRLSYARDFIHASLDSPITLEEIAQVAALSPHHFLRAFKERYHQTPFQYLTTCRINRAKELLLQTSLSVTEICLFVGYTSMGSFSSRFKKMTGQSPQFWRSSNNTIHLNCSKQSDNR